MQAGIDHFELQLPGSEATVGQVLATLAQQLPQVGSVCLSNGQLAASCLASIDGDQFVRDLQTPLHGGQSLLLLSSDAGG